MHIETEAYQQTRGQSFYRLVVRLHALVTAYSCIVLAMGGSRRSSISALTGRRAW
jgi:hypothetical protein